MLIFYRKISIELLYKIKNGVDPLAASKRVGHASPTTSYNMYGHIMKEADKRASDIFSKIMN